jgi:hypothetical protein
MDATLKRRMWKVAIVHFCLTLFVIASLHNSGWSGPSGSKAEGIWIIKDTLKVGALVLLQPQLGVLFAVAKFSPNAISQYFPWVSPRLLMAAWFVSIPIWTICFSWIFVRLDNWLNHFPVLGKKVF